MNALYIGSAIFTLVTGVVFLLLAISNQWPRGVRSVLATITALAAVSFAALLIGFVDMVKTGIVDPAKVTRSIQNAASIAGLVLTTETLVVDKPEPKKPGGGMGGMADGGLLIYRGPSRRRDRPFSCLGANSN